MHSIHRNGSTIYNQFWESFSWATPTNRGLKVWNTYCGKLCLLLLSPSNGKSNKEIRISVWAIIIGTKRSSPQDLLFAMILGVLEWESPTLNHHWSWKDKTLITPEGMISGFKKCSPQKQNVENGTMEKCLVFNPLKVLTFTFEWRFCGQFQIWDHFR